MKNIQTNNKCFFAIFFIVFSALLSVSDARADQELTQVHQELTDWFNEAIGHHLLKYILPIVQYIPFPTNPTKIAQSYGYTIIPLTKKIEQLKNITLATTNVDTYAYATTISSHNFIVFNKNFFNHLTRSNHGLLNAITAHESTHIKEKHIPIQTIAGISLIVLLDQATSYYSNLIDKATYLIKKKLDIKENSSIDKFISHVTYANRFIATSWPFKIFAHQLIMAKFSRYLEYRADMGVIKLADKPSVKALIKWMDSFQNNTIRKPQGERPLSDMFFKIIPHSLAKYFKNHPSDSERIAYLTQALAQKA